MSASAEKGLLKPLARSQTDVDDSEASEIPIGAFVMPLQLHSTVEPLGFYTKADDFNVTPQGCTLGS